MRHIDHELLAGLALGERDALSRRDRMHLLICRQCGAELAELRAIVATGRVGMPYELRPPQPGVLNLIQAELAGDVGPARDHPSQAGSATRTGSSLAESNLAGSSLAEPTLKESTPPDELSVRRAASPRVRRVATAAIAAVTLAAVSVGGVLWYQRAARDDVVVVARATLQPLPDKSGQGTAELVRQDGVDRLRVDARSPGAGAGFEELWLLNTDGKRMISLGVLPPDGVASYPVPVTTGGGLDGYTIVDISLEPFDGIAAHSSNSLLRGSLA